MQVVRAQLERCANVQLPVLLRGETGTGKDIVAQAIHGLNASTAPWVPLNCRAISERLAESELFGHRRDAFTGAIQHRQGVFERAGAGTVFLDEVAELSLELQPKLLRVLENGTYLPLGADRELETHARIIAATHRPLERWVQDKRFREDLLYRLDVLTIELPPLRERAEDMSGLLAHFSTLASDLTKRKISLAPCAVDWAHEQRWPGNLRQLRNTVLRAAAWGAAKLNRARLREAYREPPPSEDHNGLCVPRTSYVEMRRAILLDALKYYGSQREAAIALELPKSTLADWMKKLKISELGACLEA